MTSGPARVRARSIVSRTRKVVETPEAHTRVHVITARQIAMRRPSTNKQKFHLIQTGILKNNYVIAVGLALSESTWKIVDVSGLTSPGKQFLPTHVNVHHLRFRGIQRHVLHVCRRPTWRCRSWNGMTTLPYDSRSLPYALGLLPYLGSCFQLSRCWASPLLLQLQRSF